MSWNPSPMSGGANWQGSQVLATRNQLLSTSSGLYDDLKDFNFSTISVSTLNVPLWVSTSALYVSDIKGYQIDISGILLDASGLLYAPLVSSQQGIFNITNVSVMKMEFKPTFTGNIQVTFDLGLGQAIGGLLAGLGAAVGGAFIGVGTAAGLAIQGAETGIATMIAGRPQNYITNNTYETINFTSQLQISTLGNAYPVYSSIFRTVSSVAANEVPGREIFTSSFFYPGQICVRSVSDPFNLITGDSNINSSTIQSFGQWVPLEGLEPENITANSISTNTISTGHISTGTLDAILINSDFIQSFTGAFSNLAVGTGQAVNYNAPITFETGATNYGALVGDLNRLYFQTTNGFIFSQHLTNVEGASLYIGSNANESLLNVSSIFSRGNIQANSAYFSSIIAETLTVVSTINLTSTNVENITSTATLFADTAYIQQAYVSSISSFSFNTLLGNPTGPFDITKNISYTSTSYNQTSSLTNNILSYTMVANLQDQTSFNLNIAETPFGVQYGVTTANVSQWGSTIMIFNDYQNSGTVTVDYPAVFSNANLTGTFDLQTQYSPNSGTTGYVEEIYVIQKNPSGQGFSTIASNASGENPPLPVPLNYWRFTIGSNGWVTSVENNPSPYETVNSNIFTVTQDINDVTLKTSDRLNFTAGDIVFNGTVNLNTTSVANQFAVNFTASNGYISTLSTGFINASNITVNPLTGGLNTYYYKSTVSWNLPPTQVTPLEMIFKYDSPDYLPIYSLLAPFIGNNYFNSYNVSSWNNSVWNNNVAFSLGKPLVYCGDLQAPLGAYSGFFYINNIVTSPSYALPVYYINSAGSNLLGNVAGGTYAKIATTNGTTWTITSNVPNPQGLGGGSYSNNMTITQQQQITQIVNTQNMQIQAPNTIIQTETFGLYADQIRVNSHQYGTAPSSGLPSFPIGFENTVYEDNNMSFSNVPAASDFWQSDATNTFSNINGTSYYDYNSWICQVIPSRFRTNSNLICAWDVQPSVFAISGGSGYAWGYTRYIQLRTSPGGPGSNTNNWNWVLAIPKNYCTYLS